MREIKSTLQVAVPILLLVLLGLFWILRKNGGGAPEIPPGESGKNQQAGGESSVSDGKNNPDPDSGGGSPDKEGENDPAGDRQKGGVVEVHVHAESGSEVDLYTLFFYTGKGCHRFHYSALANKVGLDTEDRGGRERESSPLQFPTPGSGPAILVAFSDGFGPVISKVELVPGKNLVSLRLPSAGYVEGAVTDSSSKPVPGGRVSLVLPLPEVSREGNRVGFPSVTHQGKMRRPRSAKMEGGEVAGRLSQPVRYRFGGGELHLEIAADAGGGFWFGNVPNAAMKLRYAAAPEERSPRVEWNEKTVAPGEREVRLVLPAETPK